MAHVALSGCGYTLFVAARLCAGRSLRQGDALGDAQGKIPSLLEGSAGATPRDLNAIRATAEVTSRPRPKGSNRRARARSVAMECVFHDGILVQLSCVAGPEAGRRKLKNRASLARMRSSTGPPVRQREFLAGESSRRR